MKNDLSQTIFPWILFLNFLPNGPHKTMFGIFEISKIEILTIFFGKFQIHDCALWRNQKPQLSGK